MDSNWRAVYNDYNVHDSCEGSDGVLVFRSFLPTNVELRFYEKNSCEEFSEDLVCSRMFTSTANLRITCKNCTSSRKELVLIVSLQFRSEMLPNNDLVCVHSKKGHFQSEEYFNMPHTSLTREDLEV